MTNAIRGLIAATFTAFDRSDGLDLGPIPDYAARLRADGVAGAFVNGTTGEGLAMSADERRSNAEAWLAQRSDDFPVIVHVGCTDLPTTIALAQHAAEHGADAIAACAPSYVVPDAACMAAWLQAIIDATPALPLYYYHIPVLTGTSFAAEAVARLVSDLTGIKYTHEDLMDFQRCAELDDGRLDCLYGRDQQLLAALAHGAVGAVGSTYNWAAPLYREVIAAWDAGDLTRARERMAASQALVALMQRHGPGAGKALMACAGLDCGRCRLPLPRLEPDQLRADYQTWRQEYHIP